MRDNILIQDVSERLWLVEIPNEIVGLDLHAIRGSLYLDAIKELLLTLSVSSRIVRLAKLIIVIALMASSQAYAQGTIIQMSNYTLAPDNGNGQTVILNFNSFSSYALSSGNVLYQVDLIEQSATLSGTVTITNNSSTPQTYTGISLYGQYTLSTVAPGTAANNAQTVVTVNYPNSPPVAAGTNYTTANSQTTIPGNTTVLTAASDPTDIALYVNAGNPTVAMSLTEALGSAASGFGSHNENELGNGSGIVELEFFYTPVPEPYESAEWMLVFGLGLLAVRRYHKLQPFVKLA